jgi:hypothetical protein
MRFLALLIIICAIAWLVLWISAKVRDGATRWGMLIGGGLAILWAFLKISFDALSGYFWTLSSATEDAVVILVTSATITLVGAFAGWLWGGLFEWIAPPREPTADPSDEEFAERL